MMERALADYRNGDMELNCAAHTYNIPKATLKRRLDAVNINVVEGKQSLGKIVDLSAEIYNDLVHTLLLEEQFFGLTSNDIRCLAFQIAKANNLPSRFNREL